MFRPPVRFAILVAAALGCSGLALAQANFTFAPNNPTPNQLVQFTDTSVPTPTQWTWNFGDPASGGNNTSTLQNPTHIFAAAGDYTVSLTIPPDSTSTQTVHVASAGGGCQAGAGFLCLGGGRFQVNATWTRNDGTTGAGTAVKLTDDSGYFYFFDPTNIEMVVKVLNGCSINNAYWVFAAGLTNVQVDWQVLDTATGVTYTNSNPQNTPFAQVEATDAFTTSCP